MVTCANCGASNAPTKFCTSCGKALQYKVSEPTPAQPHAQTNVRPVVPFQSQEQATPAEAAPGAKGWTFLKSMGAVGWLVGVGAMGFLITYFLIPLDHGSAVASAPKPRLANSDSFSYSGAPDADTDEGKAWEELRRIAAQDRAALQSTQLWRAQLASSPATESAVEFLQRYRDMIQEYPNALLTWSGDWPSSYGPSSTRSWVILSDFTDPYTQPIIDWCSTDNRQCWAKRLSDFGTPEENTDHAPADASKN